MSTTYSPEQIMLIRRRLGLNQSEFGKRLGVTREWVSRAENSTNAIEVSERMKTSLEELAPLTNEASPNPLQVDRGAVQINRKYQLSHADPTVADLTAHFVSLLEKTRLIPGGLFQLQRNLKRFEKEMIDPVDE